VEIVCFAGNIGKLFIKYGHFSQPCQNRSRLDILFIFNNATPDQIGGWRPLRDLNSLHEVESLISYPDRRRGHLLDKASN
jgi:hypothetical protein